MSDDLGSGVRDALRRALLEVVLVRGYRRAETPFTLSSGGESYDYVDLRKAVSEGADLRLAAQAVLGYLSNLKITFDAIGGMTMGADPVAHAVAVLGGSRWFSVRKAEKSHGSRQRIEGATLTAGVRVVVFEDTTSTGRSLLEAIEVVRASGAETVAAVTLLDRGADTGAVFEVADVPFHALLTYADLGIEPLGSPRASQ